MHDTPESLIRSSDLVVFATVAGQPHVTDPSWFDHHPLVLHVSLRDLAPEILLDAINVVDDVEHCLKADTSPHLAEQATGNRDFLHGTLDDVMSGRITVPADRTMVFSPFGLGVLDLAVGKFVYDEAARAGSCTSSTTSSTSCAGTGEAVDSMTGAVDVAGGEWLQYDYGPALMPPGVPGCSPCGGTGTCCRSPTVRCGIPYRSAARRCCPSPRSHGAGRPTPVAQGRDPQPDGVEQGPRHRPGDRGRSATWAGDDHRPPPPETQLCPPRSVPRQPVCGPSSSSPSTASRTSWR